MFNLSEGISLSDQKEEGKGRSIPASKKLEVWTWQAMLTVSGLRLRPVFNMFQNFEKIGTE